MPQAVTSDPKLEFLTYFRDIEDYRQAAKVTYPLEEIFLLVLCAVICGADGWSSIALYGRKKTDFLRRFLPFSNGTPSHDTLGILFSRLDMDQFQMGRLTCFEPTENSHSMISRGYRVSVSLVLSQTNL